MKKTLKDKIKYECACRKMELINLYTYNKFTGNKTKKIYHDQSELSITLIIYSNAEKTDYIKDVCKEYYCFTICKTILNLIELEENEND